MNLFNITESFDAEINKEWILLIPAFSNLVRADKGSTGDSEGRKKLKARKQLAYVYFMVDFRSPIYEYEKKQKHEEALRYTGLTTADTELSVVQDAIKEYDHLQKIQARSLRTLESAKLGMDALDDYMQNIDFKKTDKMGKLLNSPKEFVDNLKNLNKAYDEIEKFEKRVMQDLKETSSIRGSATLGDKERTKDVKQTTWDEGSAPETAGPSFGDLTVHMNKAKAKNLPTEDEEEDTN